MPFAVAFTLATPLAFTVPVSVVVLRLAPLPGAVKVTTPPEPIGSTETLAVMVTANVVPKAVFTNVD